MDPRIAVKQEAERRKNGNQQTFAEFFVKWVDAGRRPLEEGSKRTYASVYKHHYEEPFGKRRLCDIEPQHIEDWKKRERDRGFKPYGIEIRLKVLASIFRHAVELRILDFSPIAKSPRKRDRETSFRPVLPSDIPSRNQFLDIANDIRADLQLPVWLMGGAGLRAGESLAVARCSFDFDSHQVTVDHKIDQHKKGAVRSYGSEQLVSKGTKWRDENEVPRIAPIIGPVETAAMEHIDAYGYWGDRDWLMRSPKIAGRHPTYQYLLDRFHEAERRVAPGRDFTPKAMRHFFVTELINKGIPVWTIAQVVGHRSTEVTEKVYAHFIPRNVTDLALQLRGWLNAPDVVEIPTDDASDAEARLLDRADSVRDS
jgi:integrase